MAYRDSVISTGTGGTLAATTPTIVAGDRLLCFIAHDVSGVTLGAASGWDATPLASGNITGPDGHTYAVFEKKSASGSEGATQTFTTSGTNPWIAIMVSLSGRDTSAAATFATPTVNTSSNASPISISGASGTAAAGDDILSFIGLDTTSSGDTWADSGWSSSLTEREDGNGTWCHASLATLDAASGGAFGSVSATSTRTSGSGGAGWVLVNVAIPAAPAAATGLYYWRIG